MQVRTASVGVPGKVVGELYVVSIFACLRRVLRFHVVFLPPSSPSSVVKVGICDTSTPPGILESWEIFQEEGNISRYRRSGMDFDLLREE